MATECGKQVLDFLWLAEERFLYGLEQVPEERLAWTPGGSATDALGLAGKMSIFVGFVAHMITTQAMPDRSTPRPPAPVSAEEARRRLKEAFGLLRAAVEGLTEEDLEKTAPAPWGAELTVRSWLWFIVSSVGYWQGQLNYLQLAYGDEKPNIPPSWFVSPA